VENNDRELDDYQGRTDQDVTLLSIYNSLNKDQRLLLLSYACELFDQQSTVVH
jgi:hypothetical protein